MDKFVVAFNTGEAPVNESLFSAIREDENEILSQVFSRPEAESVAEKLNGVGGGPSTYEPKPTVLAFLIPVNHPAVIYNPRTKYVRIDAKVYAANKLVEAT